MQCIRYTSGRAETNEEAVTMVQIRFDSDLDESCSSEYQEK